MMRATIIPCGWNCITGVILTAQAIRSTFTSIDDPLNPKMASGYKINQRPQLLCFMVHLKKGHASFKLELGGTLYMFNTNE